MISVSTCVATGVIEQALEYYHKAEEISKHDENLCLNIARAYYEKGSFDRCIKYIKKSLKLNPELEEGIMFWSYLKGIGYISEEEDSIDIDVDAFQKRQKKKRSYHRSRDRFLV